MGMKVTATDQDKEQNQTENEIIELQTKISYLEDFLMQLQEVTVEHTKTIERLVKDNQILKGKIQEMAEQLEGEIPNRKPPHY